MFWGCFLDFLGMLYGCVGSVFWMYWVYFLDVLGMFSGCFGDVFWMLWGCILDVLGMHSGCFGDVFWMFLRFERSTFHIKQISNILFDICYPMYKIR